MTMDWLLLFAILVLAAAAISGPDWRPWECWLFLGVCDDVDF
jgi:hypothetical protein